MGGTKESAKRAMEAIYDKFGEDHFRKIGSQGGKWDAPERRGFYTNRELASRAGKIGGTKSRRKKRVV